ncbi:MAG: ABC transporter permease [Solirubrobacteraceae bacterium]|nr:ABC transporter permease [Solirubrobacteraceae bacterium]
MGALLEKGLRILGRSPLLVGVLILYPLLVALLIGLALSRGPEDPKIAIVNQTPPGDRVATLAGTKIDTEKFLGELERSVDAVPVETREEAVTLVEDGDVLAAIILPDDISKKLEGAVNLFGTEPPKIEVITNDSDPVKARYVDTVIDARVADANRALSAQFAQLTAGYLEVLLRGGRLALGPVGFDIQGLGAAKRKIDAALRELPRGTSERRGLAEVSEFAGIALDNLDFSNQLVKAVSQPLTVERTEVSGRDTPLETFAVAIAAVFSLMLVALLLGAGLVALERQEHTFARLVRGLVRPEGLLAEKSLLAGGCGAVVALILLGVVALFVPLEGRSFGGWAAALALGGLAFAALGVALGVLAREVQTASLLAFALALPLAFLALVPDNAVSGGISTAIDVLSAAFPAKPSLDALEPALAGGSPDTTALVHLAILAVVYFAIARLGVRRLAR